MGTSGVNENQNKKKVDKKERIEEGIIPASEKIEILENTGLKYMEKYIYKINDTSIGIEFFCKIKYSNELIPVLMANYHYVIDYDFLKNNKFIKIYIKENYHIININKNSIIYSSKNNKYDIMIINWLYLKMSTQKNFLS